MTRALACILLALLSGCGSHNATTPVPSDPASYNANQDATIPAPPDVPITAAWIGDSYVALGAWPSWFPGSINLGHGGDDTGAILARMPAGVPATVYLWCGANDINEGVPDSVTLANYGAIIDAAKQAGAQHVICLSALPYAVQFPGVWHVYYNPTVTAVLDLGLESVAVAHGATWIDLRPAIVDQGGWCAGQYSMPAGIHLNSSGYVRILTLLQPAG